MTQRLGVWLRGAAFLAILGGVALATTELRADEAGWGYDLANHLMSPFCPGRTLPDCTSEQAAELRRWIIEQDKQGRSRADVEAQIYARYGDVILQAPKATGFGLAAYLIPIALSLASAGILIVFLRRHAGRGAAEVAAGGASPAATAVDPELERLVDEELSRR